MDERAKPALTSSGALPENVNDAVKTVGTSSTSSQTFPQSVEKQEKTKTKSGTPWKSSLPFSGIGAGNFGAAHGGEYEGAEV